MPPEAVQSHELTRVARQVRDNERRLASQVDAVAALTLLQRDLFARINPAIVEAYLDRLAGAGVLAVSPHCSRPWLPPPVPARGRPAARQLSEAAAMSMSPPAATPFAKPRRISTSGDTITLGPGEPGFTDLIALADTEPWPRTSTSPARAPIPPALRPTTFTPTRPQ